MVTMQVTPRECVFGQITTLGFTFASETARSRAETPTPDTGDISLRPVRSRAREWAREGGRAGLVERRG